MREPTYHGSHARSLRAGVVKEARVRDRAVWCRAVLLIFSCALAALSLSCAKQQAPLIPRAVLFGNPVKASPSVSPDGKMMAYLAPADGVLNLWVRTMGARDDRVVTKDTGAGIRNYLWAEDGRHILFLQDVGGNENWRLYGVDLVSGSISDLTPFDSVQVRVLYHNRHFPDELLIEMNREHRRLHDVYRLDLRTSALSLVAKNPGNAVDWVADPSLVVRGVLEATPDGGFDLLVRNGPGDPWRKLLTWDADNALSSGPLSFTRDGASLYCIDSRDANTGRLVKISLADGSSKVVAEDPEYDVTDVMFDPETYEAQAVAFTKERREWIILDDSLRGDFGAIVKLDRGDFFVASRDNADRTWLVGFTKDDTPVSYYAYDRASKKGEFLFEPRGELARYSLARMEPVSFTSRDSLMIHGYLTLPLGKAPTGLPLVLRVHDGPWTRDVWGFNGEVQWLANRGYAVLQVNFRGSAGYGKRFLNAGNKEWGGRMQSDLVDGVLWAVSRGIADPKRVGVYGFGYGGYAVLAGLAFTPDIFSCGVDGNGPSDLASWIMRVPSYWFAYRSFLYRHVGDPLTEADLLESRSPLFRAAAIKAPLMIVQGANDSRSPRAESDSIVAALRAKSTVVDYLVFPDEGSILTKPANRLSFYEAAEKFLGRNLGGRFEGAGKK
jgi:dipeptidyl aminopeptidase/acylaminoacyl peptidase